MASMFMVNGAKARRAGALMTAAGTTLFVIHIAKIWTLYVTHADSKRRAISRYRSPTDSSASSQ